MGMYTEIFFRAEVDEYVYEIMHTAEMGSPLDRLMNSGSAYFPEVEPSGPRFYHDTRYNHYNVEFRANLKNYDGEIARFFAWVAPHCISLDGFIGYSLYEENRHPTLFFADGTTKEAT